jgi:hypothetical protein
LLRASLALEQFRAFFLGETGPDEREWISLVFANAERTADGQESNQQETEKKA